MVANFIGRGGTVLLRPTVGSSCTKWVALFLVLLPLAWPITRPAEIGGDPPQMCQDGDTPPVPAADRLVLPATGSTRYLPLEETQTCPDAQALSSLTYRGPPVK